MKQLSCIHQMYRAIRKLCCCDSMTRYGEIYIKSTTNRYDVNGDGTVNILDLVAVANGFGKDAPDVNGDGVVRRLPS